jgi:hypothetical protein
MRGRKRIGKLESSAPGKARVLEKWCRMRCVVYKSLWAATGFSDEASSDRPQAGPAIVLLSRLVGKYNDTAKESIAGLRFVQSNHQASRDKKESVNDS